MSIEDQVLALIEEGNPVPDPNMIETLPAEPAEYLADLQQRSSEVTQIDERTTQGERKRPLLIAAAAAILIVIAGIAFVLFSGGQEKPPVITEPPPTTVPAEVTTTQPAETTVPEAITAGLIGTWESGTVIAAFSETTYALVVDGVLVDTGTYVTATDPFDVIVYTSSEDSPGCEAGDEGRMSYETGEQLVLSPFDDGCFLRALLTGETGAMSPVASIDTSQLQTDFDLTGTWGTADAGATFEGDSYTFVVNGEVVDSGAYEQLTSPYRLALSPDEADETCGPITYKFSLQSGENLIFEAPEGESCPERLAIAFRELPALEE